MATPAAPTRPAEVEAEGGGAAGPQVQATVGLLLAKLRSLPAELRKQIAQVRAA